MQIQICKHKNTNRQPPNCRWRSPRQLCTRGLPFPPRFSQGATNNKCWLRVDGNLIYFDDDDSKASGTFVVFWRWLQSCFSQGATNNWCWLRVASGTFDIFWWWCVNQLDLKWRRWIFWASAFETDYQKSDFAALIYIIYKLMISKVTNHLRITFRDTLWWHWEKILCRCFQPADDVSVDSQSIMIQCNDWWYKVWSQRYQIIYRTRYTAATRCRQDLYWLVFI